VAELPTARLGRDGPEITRIGFGAWALGGGWGAQDDGESIAAIRHGLELGLNWIDTAAVYGLGHSEEVVRQALEGISDRPFVFTKCGLWWYDQPWGSPRSLRPEHVRAECEHSLRRLGVDHIDLYQFHTPDPHVPVEESWGAMADLVQEGKVRWAGVSNFDIALMELCEPILHVDSLQPPFNAIQRAAAEYLEWCAANGTGVIAYSPMMSGLLTGRFSRERMEQLDEGDWRRGFPEFTEPAFSRNLALQDALRPIAERHGASVAEVAIAWTLAWPGVTGAIVGARSAEQVDGWIGATAVELTPDDLEEIAAAIEETGAGYGQAMPPV
jgi:aryl-alcohol dehydrogenase-like predicted oxidoreductase